MAPDRQIRVMLVDDHEIMRDGLREVLQRAGDYEVVGQAEDGAAAVRVAQSLRGCLQSLELVLNLMNEPQIVPQRPDGRTVGDPRPPTPTSQARRPAPYSGPAGGSEASCICFGADAPGGWSRTICLPGRPCTSTSAVGRTWERVEATPLAPKVVPAQIIDSQATTEKGGLVADAGKKSTVSDTSS